IDSLSSPVGNLLKGDPPITYEITININGYGTVSGNGTYDEGEVASINASADTKWEFVEWTGDIDTISDYLSSSTTAVVDGDYNITANFTLREISPHAISNVVFDSPSAPGLPAVDYGNWVTIEFDYTVGSYLDIPPDVFIMARPYSNGALAPVYRIRGYNFIWPWDKKGEVGFTLPQQPGRVVVDHVKFQIMNADKSEMLLEYFIPVNYTFMGDISFFEQ
ncbi:hypothetical protein ACFLYB_04970, partial [Chloroflexota bacterium]